MNTFNNFFPQITLNASQRWKDIDVLHVEDDQI